MFIELEIEKMVHGGLGLAFHEKKALFVQGALPGESGTFQIVGKRGGCSLAVPAKITVQSPHRRKAFCPQYGACGGCNWQHIAYDTQVSYKADIFIDCLKRIAKYTLEPQRLERYNSPEKHYRLRAQFKYDPVVGAFGFFKRKTNEVLPLQFCPLLVPELNNLLTRCNKDHCRDFSAKQLKVICGTNNRIASDPVLRGLTDPDTEIEADSKTFHLKGDSFFQQNRYLLTDLGTWASAGLDGARALDLYGGCGFFSILHGDRFKELLLIEEHKRLTHLAQKNFAENGFRNFKTRAIRAERFFTAENSALQRFDVIIVDPPRSGLSKVVRKGIAACNPPAILSISCDPATHARDLGWFMHHGGYTIKQIALFDLYPNTHHLETAALLIRTS